MKKLIVSLIACLGLLTGNAQKTDHQILEKLLHNTVKFYQMLRADNGLYHDYVSTHGETNRGSAANIGMGLVAQCVASEMGWTNTAEEEIIETLQSVLGHNEQGIRLERTAQNCFIHFFDINTGKAIGEDWSPIDTDLMISGALFAKRYFNHNEQLGAYVDELYNLVDQAQFIGDWTKGQIALKMTKEGPAVNSYTLPYNEYMVVAWLAKNQAKKKNAPANKLWDKWYGNPDGLPTATYTSKSGEAYHVMTDHAVSKEFTSNFTFMFNYLFVNEFTTSEKYQEAMRQAALADRAWWNDRDDLKPMGLQPYEWGTTAGVGLRDRDGALHEGYTVDRICRIEHIGTNRDRNKGKNVALSAMAGYSPVLPDLVRKDLIAMYRDPRGLGKMTLPAREGISDGGDYILWKYSYSDLNWRPSKVEGVDYACMLLGLAALPELLGVEFFQEYNDFFNPDKPQYKRAR
ncbi:hypothetical protein KEM09_02020 [Carboxylicivirga mesophila]|uniref:Glycoamylase-like domain-containing protein n=1 Tax=Carboxylicivirga mesophila TaxID=1166478 RepID=A0ABS5K585_9BACT|nr:hypothetical protein [Carboxylicivirga mesophila]MBS2210156.1 hypothetical protein [Carboxylicivirga mesophila]